jgi:hypothetical protein
MPITLDDFLQDILKRSEAEVSTHKMFDEKYQNFSARLAQLQVKQSEPVFNSP